MLPANQQGPNGGIPPFPRVELEYFKAEPTTIKAFGASELQWKVKVEGQGPLTIKLNMQDVGLEGSKIVTPTSTKSYRLSAHAFGGAYKTLGSVVVTVATDRCTSFSVFLDPKSEITTLLKATVPSDEIFFRPVLKDGKVQMAEPVVTFSPNRIHFKLFIGSRVNNFPDPDIDIDASFGLKVSDGTIVTFGEEVNASASFPPHVWAAAWPIPGGHAALVAALTIARGKAEIMTRDSIPGIAQYIDLFAQTKVPPRNRIQTVAIDDEDDGDIQVRACPYDLLRYYATVSAVDSQIGG